MKNSNIKFYFYTLEELREPENKVMNLQDKKRKNC